MINVRVLKRKRGKDVLMTESVNKELWFQFKDKKSVGVGKLKGNPQEKWADVEAKRIKKFCQYNPSVRGMKTRSTYSLPTNIQLLLFQLQKSIYKHDWEAAARCVFYLLDFSNCHLPIIYKSLAVILLCHPNSKRHHLVDFLQMLICLRTPGDQEKFIANLLTLPENINVYRPTKSTRNKVDESDSDENEGNESEDSFFHS